MAKNKKNKKKKKHRLLWAFLYLQIIMILAVIGGISYYYVGGYAVKVSKMHSEAVKFVKESTNETFRRSQTSEAYDTDGKVISVLKGAIDSYYIPYEEIPLDAIEAIVSIEDKKFYRHPGYDIKAIARAAYAMFRDHKISQGGSTITQQLARTIFLTNDRTWERKIEEIYIAVELEKKYSKQEILEFYLNNIYFGNGYYGLEAASEGYFRKSAGALSTSQLAFLCGLPNNPTMYNPRQELSAAVGRRDRVLRNMYEDGVLGTEAFENAVMEEIKIKKPKTVYNNYMESFLFYCATRAIMESEGFVFQSVFESDAKEEEYRKEYDEKYEECNARLFSGGFRIYTTLDKKIQNALQTSIDTGLSGFKEKSDGIYKLQGAGVCIDNGTGCVKAIVGGRSQKLEGYTLNRAFQSFRQPGSSIKPLIVYTPALENGYTPNTMVDDTPIEDGPKNSDGTYEGRMTLRRAVEKSKNTVAWDIIDRLTPERGLSYLKNMDFRGLSYLDNRNAIALGGFTKGVSALEMAKGYATIENDGGYREPTCIFRITDANDEIIYENEGVESVIYETNACREMTDILQGTFINGTARGLSLDNGMPCAGKTGTTNDYKDGWFAGYTRYYTTAIWVGFDMPKTLKGLTGNSYPGHIWQEFMNKIHKGKKNLKFIKPVKVQVKKDRSEDRTEEVIEEETDSIDVDLVPDDDEDEDEDTSDREDTGNSDDRGRSGNSGNTGNSGDNGNTGNTGNSGNGSNNGNTGGSGSDNGGRTNDSSDDDIEVIDDGDVEEEDDEEPPLPPEDEADDPGDDV